MCELLFVVCFTAYQALVAVNRGAGVETASTMWAVVKWDVIYGAAYFLMVFSDNMVRVYDWEPVDLFLFLCFSSTCVYVSRGCEMFVPLIY